MDHAVDRSTPDPNRFLSTELANTATHGVGLGMSIAGLAILVVLATKFGTTLHIVACSVYGATLVLLYLASTLYHSVHHIRAKRFFELLDHSAIYLLIAGTYTPACLVLFRGPVGWSVFGVAWTVAVIGIVLKATIPHLPKMISNTLYLAMGTGERDSAAAIGVVGDDRDNNRFYVMSDLDPHDESLPPLAMLTETDLTDLTNIETGAGSSALSTRPSLPTTRSTSGREAMAASSSWSMSSAWPNDAWGIVVGM